MYRVVQPDGFFPGDVCTTYQATLVSPDRAWPADVRAVAVYIHENLFDEDLMVARVKQACGIGDNNISGRFRYYVRFLQWAGMTYLALPVIKGRQGCKPEFDMCRRSRWVLRLGLCP